MPDIPEDKLDDIRREMKAYYESCRARDTAVDKLHGAEKFEPVRRAARTHMAIKLADPRVKIHELLGDLATQQSKAMEAHALSFWSIDDESPATSKQLAKKSQDDIDRRRTTIAQLRGTLRELNQDDGQGSMLDCLKQFEVLGKSPKGLDETDQQIREFLLSFIGVNEAAPQQGKGAGMDDTTQASGQHVGALYQGVDVGGGPARTQRPSSSISDLDEGSQASSSTSGQDRETDSGPESTGSTSSKHSP